MKTIALHLLDLLQNSISAHATEIQLDVVEDKTENMYQFTITDNGKGMDKEFLEKVVDPYTTSRTTRKVGLGIPLIKMNAESAGGTFSIVSKKGEGTKLSFSFKIDHLDRPPVGNISDMVVLCAAQNESIRFVYHHQTPYGEYLFDSKEIQNILDGMSMNDLHIIRYLKDMINENLEMIHCSK